MIFTDISVNSIEEIIGNHSVESFIFYVQVRCIIWSDYFKCFLKTSLQWPDGSINLMGTRRTWKLFQNLLLLFRLLGAIMLIFRREGPEKLTSKRTPNYRNNKSKFWYNFVIIENDRWCPYNESILLGIYRICLVVIKFAFVGNKRGKKQSNKSCVIERRTGMRKWPVFVKNHFILPDHQIVIF